MNTWNVDLEDHIRTSLKEDIGTGDITTEQTTPDSSGQARFIARESGCVAGLFLIREIIGLTCELLSADPSRFSFQWDLDDGDEVEVDHTVGTIHGPANVILTAERVALNYLQQLSGVASATARCVKVASQYGVDVYDTRKTVPHFRELQKWAVRQGGGCNHRTRLDKAVMVKDNHKMIAGGLRNALESVSTDRDIVVEIHDPEELRIVGDFDIDVILMDNFDVDELTKFVSQYQGEWKYEASGGITQDNIEGYCQTGVDRVSMGSITHSASCLDISLELSMNE